MDGRLSCIQRSEVLLYLGWRGGELAPTLAADIDRCSALLIKTARPRVVWRRFPLDEEGSPVGTDLCLEGESVRQLLRGCTAVIFLAATLGAEAENLVRRAQITDMSDAVILDACGNAAIENVCDNLCDDLASAEAPLYLTDRFSPGYGDLPLSRQPDFCRLLDAQRRIGVTLTDSGLMLPQKSVTALAGVTPEPPRRRFRGCAYCEMFADCSYRKDGITCGKA